MGRFTHQMCLRHGFSPNVVFETPDPFLQGHLVRTGHAVAIVPRARARSVAATASHNELGYLVFKGGSMG